MMRRYHIVEVRGLSVPLQKMNESEACSRHGMGTGASNMELSPWAPCLGVPDVLTVGSKVQKPKLPWSSPVNISQAASTGCYFASASPSRRFAGAMTLSKQALGDWAYASEQGVAGSRHSK